MKIYCRSQHGSRELCEECTSLLNYADKRLEYCRFGEEKPTCANCTVHCYRPAEREKIKEVMRTAGPMMLLRHPMMTIMHLLDGKKTPI